MSEKKLVEMWWEGPDLHTIEDGEHWIYRDAVITSQKFEPTTPGIKTETLTFVGMVPGADEETE